MRATLLRKSKETLPHGVLVEIVIWRVPTPVLGSTHDFKYSLYAGSKGRCLVRYDNERSKGDHRHYGEQEEAYVFRSIDQLIEDFIADVERLGN
jgi:hypothetical protein